MDDHPAPAPTDAAISSPLGGPWTIRLAGARSARPALELFEAGVLLDVVSSTPIAPQLVRGARTAMGRRRPRTIAWGRLPAVGGRQAVEFWRAGHRIQAAVVEVTDWCWVAVSDGNFDRLVVSVDGSSVQYRVSGVRRWP